MLFGRALQGSAFFRRSGLRAAAPAAVSALVSVFGDTTCSALISGFLCLLLHLYCSQRSTTSHFVTHTRHKVLERVRSVRGGAPEPARERESAPGPARGTRACDLPRVSRRTRAQSRAVRPPADRPTPDTRRGATTSPGKRILKRIIDMKPRRQTLHGPRSDCSTVTGQVGCSPHAVGSGGTLRCRLRSTVRLYTVAQDARRAQQPAGRAGGCRLYRLYDSRPRQALARRCQHHRPPQHDACPARYAPQDPANPQTNCAIAMGGMAALAALHRKAPEPFLSPPAHRMRNGRNLARAVIIMIEGIIAHATFDDARRVDPRATQHMGTWAHSLKPFSHAHISLDGAVPPQLRTSVGWP